MADWKSALAALGATSDNVEASEKKDVDRKKTSRRSLLYKY